MEEKREKYLNMKGKVFTGLGEGAYYLSLKGYKEQIKNKFGWYPYPGTLNIKLKDKNEIEVRKQLMNLAGILIKGFRNENRSYGWVKCLPAEINGIKGAVLTCFEKTRYDETILEFIAPICVREALKVKDGDFVDVKVICCEKEQ